MLGRSVDLRRPRHPPLLRRALRLGSEDPIPSSGYVTFLRDGVRVAGCRGAMGERRANDAWKTYLGSEGVPSHWSVCWHVDDADPAGAEFELRTPPS